MLFEKVRRNWLVAVVPNYGKNNPLEDPNGTIWSNAAFIQDGGTLARKLLTKKEAYTLAEVLASKEREESFDCHYLYYPVELTDSFKKIVSVTSVIEKVPLNAL